MTTPTESHFFEQGVLTPDEFVQSGELLISKCPTWKWSTGHESKLKDYLPKDKQFLITKNVPCIRRAKDYFSSVDGEKVERELEDDWTEAFPQSSTTIQEGIEEIANEDDDDEIVDADDYLEDELDDNVDDQQNNNSIIKTRTYDIAITYDKYYRTPRVWLFGYDENGKALPSEKCLEDIHEDYTGKSVTIEDHPHLKEKWLSIHPCRHASVMKKIVDQMAEDNKFVRVEMYLYLFLKFISAVIPTIEYDFTIMVST